MESWNKINKILRLAIISTDLHRNTSQKTQTLIDLYLLKHKTLQKERLHIKSKEIWSKPKLLAGIMDIAK